MEMDARKQMKWWGWGSPEKRPPMPEKPRIELGRMLECELAPNEVVDFERVELPKPELPDGIGAMLEEIVGSDSLLSDRKCRILHSAGKSYPDLLSMRSGKIAHAPDAVAYPQSHDQVMGLLKICSDERIAVIPFGGGTSVVGGVEPIREGFRAALTLDLSKMDRLGRIDEESLTAQLGPGMVGPQVEASLGKHDLTLGHFPQSYEYSTLGGWVATRSAGQASTGYGKIEELVVGAGCATPVGDIDLKPFPASAAGPQLRDLVVGSEGVLGIITDTTMRVHRAPEKRLYEGWMFKSFPEGVKALRKLIQDEIAPDVVRLSDEAETQTMMLMAGDSKLKTIADSYIRLRRFEGGCMAIFGFEGEPDRVDARKKLASKALRSSGALHLGGAPGKSWLRHRFEGPYLRDDLMDMSIFIDTLETATSWSNLMSLYQDVKNSITRALADRGSSSLVMCHISHLYPTGASLYFTFLSPQEREKEIEQWLAVKRAASEAISNGGGTITHHHAVGIDHRPWITRELGDNGVAILRSVKEVLDPVGVMNPGKLIPK